jgi:hypothetical protein
MDLPDVVPQDEWESAQQQLRVKEKETTKARDALAAERRRRASMPPARRSLAACRAIPALTTPLLLAPQVVSMN